jgi:hypothetical protein
MSLNFESIQDAIEKEDPSLEAISATINGMHEGLAVKFAQHYHDDWSRTITLRVGPKRHRATNTPNFLR